MRAQLREAQETIEAIRGGGVDSLMIGPPGQEQVYALASADRPYRLIVEAMNEGAATVSPRGVILDANPRLAAMTGRSATELIGTAVLDLIPDAHRAAFAALLDVGAGDSARGEVELTGPGGTTVPVLLAVSGFDLDGMLLRCLVLTDLTAQRAAETQAAEVHEALREQNAFLERAQESLGLGWWNYDPEREEMLTFSPAACRIFGLTPAEFDGKLSPLESRPPGRPAEDQRGVQRRRWRAALPTRPSIGSSGPTARCGGSSWPGSCSGMTRAARDGCWGSARTSPTGSGSRTRSAPAAAYNRSLIEANLNPMVTIGPDGAITDVNTATEQATGYGRAELIGTEFSGYFTEPDLARAGYEQVFRDGSARDYPLELRHRDGHITSVLYNAAVYRDPAGRVLGVVAAARDVTQVNRTQAAQREAEAEVRALNADLEARVQQRTADLERANKNLEAFTYSVSHDLRAPLRALNGFSEALLEEYGDRLDETGRGYAGRIQAASERMAALIDDLLQLSRVSRSRA